MVEKFVLQNGKKVSVIDPKSFKKKELITIPQAFYKNSIFLPVLQNQYQHEINLDSKKTIKVDYIGKFNIFYPILNQTDVNIIDAILYNALKIDDFGIGACITVVLSEVLNTLHIRHDYSWFYSKITEIQKVFFYVYKKYHEKLPDIQAPIISFISDSDKMVQNKYIGYQKRYAPYKIFTFSPLFNYLIQNSYAISFPRDFIPKIIDLKYPINQAIARYCLATGDVNENLEGLLVKLGVATGKINSDKHPIQESLRYRYFSYIKAEQDKLLQYFGIQIIKNNSELILRANKNDAVRIYAPKSSFLNI